MFHFDLHFRILSQKLVEGCKKADPKYCEAFSGKQARPSETNRVQYFLVHFCFLLWPLAWQWLGWTVRITRISQPF